MHICDTYNYDYLLHALFHFYLIDFRLNTDFPSQFCVFTIKSPRVTQRLVSQEKAFQKSKNPLAFFSQNYRLKKFFYSNWKQFQVLKIVNIEFKVTIHYGLRQNAPSCDPLMYLSWCTSPSSTVLQCSLQNIAFSLCTLRWSCNTMILFIYTNSFYIRTQSQLFLFTAIWIYTQPCEKWHNPM